MKKIHLFLGLLILLVTIFSLTGAVNAAEEVTDRELAITAAYTYMPWFKEGKKVTEGFDIGKFSGISTVANKINTKFNLHNYATAEELDDWIVDDFNGLKSLKQNGLNVLRIKRGNDIIIGIEGSFSPVDAFEDIKYGLTNYTNQEKYLKEYIKQTLDEYSNKEGIYNFYVTGHSLGGYLAQIGGAELERLITENAKYSNLKLAKIVDFNGMGINFFTLFGDKYNYGSHQTEIEILKKLGNEGRLIEYYVYGDVVSALGVHYGEMRQVTPSIDSITYHRTNYKMLKTFGRTLVQLAEKQTVFNAFKTSLDGAESFYGVNNIAAYLNLTHEVDHFVTLQPDTSKNAPEVKIIENKSILSSHVQTGKSSLTIRKSTTLKAVTSNASAKKYEWYSSDDKKNWTLVKTIDLYNLAGKVPENTFEIDVNSIKVGKSKYYKVISYYDDNYVSSKYNYNQKIKQYEYVKTGETTNASGTVESIIKVTRNKDIKSTMKSLILKLKK